MEPRLTKRQHVVQIIKFVALMLSVCTTLVLIVSLPLTLWQTNLEQIFLLPSIVQYLSLFLHGG